MPSGKCITTKILDMIDENDDQLEVARHPKQIIKIKIKYKLPVYTILRKKKEL